MSEEYDPIKIIGQYYVPPKREKSHLVLATLWALGGIVYMFFLNDPLLGAVIGSSFLVVGMHLQRYVDRR